MVDCEACSVQLTDDNLQEVVDSTKKTRLICTKCKKLSERVTNVFDSLEWPAFIKFVANYEESQKDYKMDIGIKKQETGPNPPDKK